MTEPAPPRWPLVVFAALLALPFDPGWIDFEQARRGMLLVAVGLLLVLRPGRAGAHAALGVGDAVLLAFVGWQGIAALANVRGLVVSEAVLRLLHWLALVLCWRFARGHALAGRQSVAAAVLLATTLFGLLQRLGLAEIAGYGVAAQPVSFFGNLNVAAEVTAVTGAAAAAALARPEEAGAGLRGARWLPLLALALGAAYAVVNGSRSAMIALPAAALWVAATARGSLPRAALRRGFLPLGVVVAGGLLGVAVQAVARVPDAPPAAVAAAAKSASVDVRLEIAGSGLAMLADRPVFGFGPGQFAIAYPRYRSAEEIELSSNARADVRRVDTAHDDWLQVAIEGGVPALLLLLLFAWNALRDGVRRGDLDRLAPLTALALLMVVRAPLGNAPAVAFALLAAAPAVGTAASAALAAGAPRRSGWRVLGWRSAGALVALLGVAVVLAQTFAARYVQARRAEALSAQPTAVPLAPLECSASVWPFEVDVWQLLATERMARAGSREDLQQALAAADRAIALRPFEPSYLLLRADLHRMLGDFAAARADLGAAAKLDPHDPKLQLQLAGLAFTQGDVATTVATLWIDPHARLREQLAERFDEFADLARKAGMEAAHRRFVAEAAFVRALDASAAADGLRRRAAEVLREDARVAFATAGLLDQDLRIAVLEAAVAAENGNEALAGAILQRAHDRGARLPSWSHALLAPRLRLVERLLP